VWSVVVEKELLVKQKSLGLPDEDGDDKSVLGFGKASTSGVEHSTLYLDRRSPHPHR
jgi:hypothetical protein